MLYKEKLEEILRYYGNIAESYKRVLKDSPPGRLLYQKCHGHDQFLHYQNDEGRKTRTAITRDEDMIKALARKEFAERAFEVVQKNYDALKQSMGAITPYDPAAIIEAMNNCYSKLPEEFFFGKDYFAVDTDIPKTIAEKVDRHREWGLQPFKQSTYKKENKKIKTSRGEMVRSKSEALIIESLYRIFDIPHRYEQEQWINGVRIVPDLTFEGAGGKLFYWDHLGMMDRPDYADYNFNKLRRNYSAGLVPGDNVILSFDRQGTIDMKYIEGIIMDQVIPRL